MNPAVLSAGQIQRLDQLAIEKERIPSLVLMENAGRAAAGVILRQCRAYQNPFVCVVCGTGNNGGDGFVVSRHLQRAGVATVTYLVGKTSGLKQDALANYRILKKQGSSVHRISQSNRFLRQDIARADVIVDALFGVGLNRNIQEPFKSIIELINSRKPGKTVISLDVPSGLDATTGAVFGVCVQADLTVTFSAPKQGFYKKEGRVYTGRVKVVDIGIPKKLMKSVT